MLLKYLLDSISLYDLKVKRNLKQLHGHRSNFHRRACGIIELAFNVKAMFYTEPETMYPKYSYQFQAVIINLVALDLQHLCFIKKVKPHRSECPVVAAKLVLHNKPFRWGRKI